MLDEPIKPIIGQIISKIRHKEQEHLEIEIEYESMITNGANFLLILVTIICKF